MRRSFKTYMLSIMQDKKEGGAAFLLKCLLRSLSWIYSLGVRITGFCYESGVRRVRKVPAPVISIGNITLGGTGKTPLSVFTALYLERKEKKPAVLTRGYGNDEKKMLVDELPEIPVFVGQDRVRSAEAAIAAGRDVLVLDDGFQHRRIARDLDILMLDSDAAFGNGYIFPRGILREPISALKRADVLVLSKIDKIEEGRKKRLIEQLISAAPGKLFVTSRHRPTCLNDVTGAVYPVESLKGQRVCALSGIADPGYFASSLERTGADVVLRMEFADHHSYTQKDMAAVYRSVSDKKIEKVITTKKDYVKLQQLDISFFEEKLFILDIEMEIVDNREDFLARLDSVVSG